MTNLQRLQLERLTVARRVNALTTEIETRELGTDSAEYGERKTKLAELDRFDEQIEAEMRTADTTATNDGESREYAALESRATLAGFVAGIHEGQVTGAEAEFRSAVLGESHGATDVPLQMLMPRSELSGLEERAVTPVAAGAISEGNQQTIAGRVFARSVPAFLGIPMPTVPAGSAGYPRLSGGTTFSVQAKSGSQAAVAGSFAGNELKPRRGTGSYEFRVEDVSELVGIEDALRSDLRAGIGNLLNNQAVNGSGTAPNVSGILNAVTATPSTDPTGADSFSDLASRFTSAVDGLYANDLADLRLVMRGDIYSHMASTFATNDDSVSAYDHLRERVGGVMVNNILPAKDGTSNIGNVIVRRTGSDIRHSVMPVWNAFSVVVDPYSLAQQGEIRLTASVLFNFAVTETSAYQNIKVRTS